MINNRYFPGIIFFFMTSFFVKAQETSSVSSCKVTADLVSSYVWRGVLSTEDPTPNFQPSLAFVKGALELGAWGSTDFIGSYKEIDLYASYTTGAFKFTATDYNWNFKTGYFNYKKNETDHILEGSVVYSGSESFPVNLSANVMVFGADKKYDTGLMAANPEKQAYSTYIELSYVFKNFFPFIGITPSDGYYGDGYGGATGFGVVNLGITGTKSLSITNNFSLPLKATLEFNPQKEDAYLVFAMTL